MKFGRGLIRSVWTAVPAIGWLAALCGSSCEAERVDVAARASLAPGRRGGMQPCPTVPVAWQLLAIAALFAVAVSLIVGTAWGSRARRDAQAHQGESPDEKAE